MINRFYLLVLTLISLFTYSVQGQNIQIEGKVLNDLTPSDGEVNGLSLSTTDSFFIHVTNNFGLTVFVQKVQANGDFVLSNIAPNTNYTLVLAGVRGALGIPAPNYMPSNWAFSGEDCCDGTGNDGILDGKIALSVGNTDITQVNFGIQELLSIGNLVWHDLNSDGLKDSNEPGIQGASVKVYKDADLNGFPDAGPIMSTNSDATGYYSFNGLYSGDYIVGVTPPSTIGSHPYVSVTINEEQNPNADQDNNDNGILENLGEFFSGTIHLSLNDEPLGEVPNYVTALDENANLTIDFGFYQEVSISGTLYNDQDGPSILDGISTGILGTIEMFVHVVNQNGIVVSSDTIDAAGNYSLTNITPNQNYQLRINSTLVQPGNAAISPNKPFGWAFAGEDCCDQVGNDGNANGRIDVQVGISDIQHVNFAVRQPFSLGNLVWEDKNRNGIKDAAELGIENAMVLLYEDANGNNQPDGPAINAVFTDVDGIYHFYDLYEGNYLIGVVPPTPTIGNPFISSKINEFNPNLNIDDNDNGMVEVNGEIRTNKITLSSDEPLGELPNDPTVKDANANFTLDVGLYQPVNLKGNIFSDTNGPINVDGISISAPDGNPLYINLVNAQGISLNADVVQANGSYIVKDVPPNITAKLNLSTTLGVAGNVAPVANVPWGWINVSEDCCDLSGNDGNTNGELDLTIAESDVINLNFGIRQLMSVGNLVWNDFNRNGYKDTTESGIAGAQVFLYKDDNADQLPDSLALQTTITTLNGHYIFNGLVPGNYMVGVIPPAPLSGNAYISSTNGQELNPNADIDQNDNGVFQTNNETRSGTITLSTGDEPLGEFPNNATSTDPAANLTIDFGFYQPVHMSGQVYYDITGASQVNGSPINAADAAPLYINLVVGTQVVATTSIQANGTFEFNDVARSTTYKVLLSINQGIVGITVPATQLPQGWSYVAEDCCDGLGNDGNANGALQLFMSNANISQMNFGIRDVYSLGNTAWKDLNQNGLKDINEGGLASCSVKLYADNNTDGSPDGAALQTTTTNATGLYVFNNLYGGNYIVGVTPPIPAIGNNYMSSVAGQEVDPNNDIDQNDNGIQTISGETFSGTILLNGGNEPLGEVANNATAVDAYANLSIDFGFYQPMGLSGNVFVDNDGPASIDGVNIGSPNGVPLFASLVGSNNVVVASVPVNLNGTYQITSYVPPANYSMVLSTTQGIVGSAAPIAQLPTGWKFVGEDCCDQIGNDGNANGITQVSVGATDIQQINFGIYQALSLGNLVWHDQNKNGLKESTETGIQLATVKLYQDANQDGNPDGAFIKNIQTDMNGLYIFENLYPGNYIVGITPPSVIGGAWTSSVLGQELNPNDDLDDNDNGITLVGGEIRSGTLTLQAGTEPLGELPNNASADISDENANLTVDAGLFICPSNFSFPTQYICNGTTFNLTSIEPQSYTGGTWTLNGNAVNSSNAVGVGTYVYTYLQGDCMASGSVVVAANIPNYTSRISITPNSTNGITNMRVVVKIEELLNKIDCSPVYVLMPKLEPRFTFTYDPTATSVLGANVSNAHWQLFNTNPNFYIWKYIGNGNFPAGGNSSFGFVGSYDPSNTEGKTNFSVQVYQGSGGETLTTDNADVDVLLYFR